MYIVRPNEAQRQYLDEMANAFPEQFKPDPTDYTRKMLISISRAEACVTVEVVSSPPKLPVEIRLGVSILIDGHEIESGEKKLLVHSIVADLVSAIDIISPRDRRSSHSTRRHSSL